MKAIAFILLLAISNCLLSQSTITPSPDLKTVYLTKSKTQRTAGWVLLGTGAVFTGIGGLIAAHDVGNSFGSISIGGTNTNNTGSTGGDNSIIAGILLLGGVSAMIGSIPCFITSSKNKHRAMALAFKNQPVQKMQQGSLVHNYMPAVSFTIKF